MDGCLASLLAKLNALIPRAVSRGKPMKIINHDQGSQEWLAWRATGIGGSDAAAVMGCSPYETALGLWLFKLGRKPPKPDNPGMKRGRDMEDEARKAYEAHTGIDVVPQCAEHDLYPFIKASFDGLGVFEDMVLEIKCPGAEDHALATQGIVPPKYWPQVQHLLLVSGHPVLHYWSYDGATGVLVIVNRDEAYIQKLLDAEKHFWACVEADTMPVESDAIAAAAGWRIAQEMLDQAKANLDWARDQLVKASGVDVTQPSSNDLGLATITVSETSGSIDWPKLAKDLQIPSDQQEAYRKPSKVSVAVRKSTEAKTQQILREMSKRVIVASPAAPVVVNPLPEGLSEFVW